MAGVFSWQVKEWSLGGQARTWVLPRRSSCGSPMALAAAIARGALATSCAVASFQLQAEHFDNQGAFRRE
jgi:hypothetical protein